MPIKVLGDAERKTNRDAVDYCQSHGPGCKKHRYPHPKIWGHKGINGRWSVTPEEALDNELRFTGEQVAALAGMSSPDEFLAWPCKVVQMPRAKYRKTFGASTEVDMDLVRLLREARPTPTVSVPDTFRPAFEEEE